MKRYNRFILSLAVASSLASANCALADNVAIHVPANFQILSLSPNGEWACGVFVDGGNSTFPFRWNLNGGSIEMLGTEPGTAWDVANDGTVSGDYPDTDILENHAAIDMPCYWVDGVRHVLEMPAGNVSDGFGGGLTADGKYMVGTVCLNGIYTPYIWHEGKISRSLPTGNHAVAYAVSPDGQCAAGFGTQYNRTACYWPKTGNVIYFMDSPDYSQTPWNYVRNFSPDGSKMVYWGGWEVNEDETELYLYCVYDIATGERLKVQAPNIQSDVEFFDISNSGMLVGFNQGRGYIYTPEQGGMYIDDYLDMHNVDLQSLCDDIYSGTDYYQGQLPVYRVVAVSEDEKVFAMMYYNNEGELSSMVLKMDQDFNALPPAECKAEQMAGLCAVSLSWKRPVGANNIRGYNIYRDGTKLNLLPIAQLNYYDTKATTGEHTYTIAAVTTTGVETKADDMKVNIAEAQLPAPYSLFARQKGACTAFIDWNAPFSNMVHKHYYGIDVNDCSGFTIYDNVDVEVAIRYSKDEMKAYAGHKLKEVSFIPMGEHNAWALNIYTYNSDNQLQLLYTQSVTQQLNYGTLNTVVLDTPQDLPNGDLVVAIEIAVDANISSVVGVQQGPVVPGYSDLLRIKTEDDLYSAYDRSLETGMALYHFSWAIDLGLEADNSELVELTHYNVYLNGELAGTTTDTTFEVPALANGNYTVGVEAQYSNNACSEPLSQTLSINTAFPKVEKVNVEISDADPSEATFAWEAPQSMDETNIAHTKAVSHNRGVHGNSSTSYSFMIASDYQPKLLRGYNGYRVKGFRFYPLSDAIFTFYLLENGKVISEFEVEDDLVYGQWNTCLLDEDIYLNDNAEYRLVIDCFDPEPNADVFAIDGMMPLDYVSDLFSTDGGQTWSSFYYETGAIGNWMMGMVLEATEAEALTIDGYDVLVDNKKANDVKLAATTLKKSALADGTHTLKVNTYYNGSETSVAGKLHTFVIDLTAVQGIEASTISIERTMNSLRVEGAKVDALALFSANGMLVAKTAGNTLDISSLPAGVYMLKVSTPTGEVKKKIIKK